MKGLNICSSISMTGRNPARYVASRSESALDLIVVVLQMSGGWQICSGEGCAAAGVVTAKFSHGQSKRLLISQLYLSDSKGLMLTVRILMNETTSR